MLHWLNFYWYSATIYFLQYNKSKNKNVTNQVEQITELQKFKEPLENKNFKNALFTIHFAHVERGNIPLKK